MADTRDSEDWQARHDAAYAAVDRGALDEAAAHFEALAAAFPERKYYEYMLGLAHKYRRDWRASLHHNLRAIDPEDGDQQGEHWNAAIAATALGDWRVAREQWRLAGIAVEPGDEPIDAHFGHVCVRLNAWAEAETLFARRISPAVAELRNVPLAESGYRFGDRVLVDGASTGQREWGDKLVPVLNAMQLMERSPFRTYVVSVRCGTRADAKDLDDAQGEGIAMVEDWTRSLNFLCTQCSYGVPHSHDAAGKRRQAFESEREFGIAARSRAELDALLDAWIERGKPKGKVLPLGRKSKREVLEIDDREHEIPALAEGLVWWRGGEADEDEDE